MGNVLNKNNVVPVACVTNPGNEFLPVRFAWNINNIHFISLLIFIILRLLKADLILFILFFLLIS